MTRYSPGFRFAVSAALLATLGISLSGCGTSATGSSATKPGMAVSEAPVELLNVACDPTRELWQDLNERFTRHWEETTGQKVTIKQSHGGSGAQARSVKDGLSADVVSLAMWPDTDLIRRNGLMAAGWENRLPEKSLPYYSTIVFVVRKGNPKNIHDWPDIVKPHIEIVTPDPKTSGNGKLSFLAAWGSVITRGGSEEAAKQFVTKIYQQTPVLDEKATAATMTFAKKGIGDVHLTWENEAQREVLDSAGALELVYPPVSFRAEPHVAWVDEVVKRHGTEAVAKEYLEFLYTPDAQEIIAKHFYRPNAKDDREKYADKFQPVKLFDITAIAKNWDDASERFFADGGVYVDIADKR